jgi:hypothetical protein
VSRNHLQIATAGTVHAVPGSTIIFSPPNDGIIDGFTIGLFFATFLLACATGFLGWKTSQLHQATKELAEDTVKGAKLSDRHHQESLIPVVVIRDVKCGPGLFGGSMEQLGVGFRVHNQGLGPAVAVNATVSATGPGLKLRGIARVEVLDPLQAGEIRENDIYFGGFLMPQDGYIAFIVRLEFLSMFGTWGICEWNVSTGSRSVLTFALPQPQNRPLDAAPTELPKGYLV